LSVIDFQESLGLASRPVAIAFRPAPPPGMRRVAAAGPSGCSYWALAAEGESFFTEAADHLGCPIGAFTHGVEMPAASATELEGLVGTMVGLGYLREAEVPGIPRRAAPFRFALYGPFPGAPFEPDVVLVRANARQAMLLGEAASAAGAFSAGDGAGPATMLRPTCAALPAAIGAGRAALSLGCVGNRVYTKLPDDAMYVAIPGAKLAEVAEQLAVILAANRALDAFHRGRAAAAAAGRTP
jgi:uncharacterized protein (DUF169 family)